MTTLRTRAVLFDLDGTLYDQAPLRRAMLLELARGLAVRPFTAPRTMRRLKVFREAREELRDLGDSSPSLEEAQYRLPAERLGDDPAGVRATVDHWMHERPLRHIARAGWSDLRSTLQTLRERGLDLGVFSDYPPDDKLAALGVADLFDVTVAATDDGVNAFKPHPRGFQVGASRLGVEPGDVVYVGDRVDVDVVGAAAAGMRCVLVGPGREGLGSGPAASAGRGAAPVAHVETFGELSGLLHAELPG